jgi:hypothetical protein
MMLEKREYLEKLVQNYLQLRGNQHIQTQPSIFLLIGDE